MHFPALMAGIDGMMYYQHRCEELIAVMLALYQDSFTSSR
jgi:hypothetical protein